MEDSSGPSAELSPISDRGGSQPLETRQPDDDGAIPNPQGRNVLDGRRLKTRGRLLKIGTWNVRTLHKAGNFECLMKEMKAMKMDIMGISETRWTDGGRVTDGEYEFVYSGGDKRMGGVGIMMRKDVASSMTGMWPVTDRIIMVKLSGKPFNINIIQVYAPTTDHEEEEIESFYEDINKVMDYTKSGEITILMGDWNAKVGDAPEHPVVGNCGLGERNNRGTRLVNFCTSRKLVLTNTYFNQPKRRLYTWHSPGDQYRNQIDFILVSQRHFNSVKNVKTYPGADIGSDHNPIVMKFMVKLKKQKHQRNNPKLNMDKLKDERIKIEYNVAVKNKYEALIQEQEEVSTENEWNAIRDSMVKAAEEILPKKERIAKQPWMTVEILEKMEERKKEKNKDSFRYRQLKRQIDDECTKAKEKYWNEKCTEIETLEKHHKSRDMHKKIKEVVENRKDARGSNCIKDKNGKMLFDAEEIKCRWEEYVTELYSDIRHDPPNTLNEDGPDIMLSEVKKAIKMLKANKAPGNDQITSEMIKALDDDGVLKIHKLLNQIYRTGSIPQDMNESTFVRLPKKAKATMCTEYRTLSLMSHILKALLRIILMRNIKRIENEISEMQSGFITGKGTREGIFNMRMICERYSEMNRDIYACFIDYEKAFDRVNHEKMVKTLQDIGLDGKDLKLIINLYWTQKAFIRLEQGMSEPITISRGVRQGCVLSPCLFNLYTEVIFRHITNKKGIKIGGIPINNLRYADDTVLLAENEEDLQDIVNEINQVGLTYGMKINAKKTKTMVISRNSPPPQVEITIDTSNIEQLQNFTYLGHQITENAKCDGEIKRRIEIARSTFSKMNRVLTSNRIPLKTRSRLVQCYVWSTLLYGAETWTVATAIKKKLEALEMWVYRRMLKISWKDKIRNEVVLQRMNITSLKHRLFFKIQKKKLGYFGHIIRHNTLQRALLDGRVEGRRGRGRPRTMWSTNITQWTGINYVEAARSAQNRRLWRDVVSNPIT